jgi:hypothetical protein
LDEIKLDHLIASADGDDPVNGSIMAHLASAAEDWSTFVPSTDSLQALRDRGDAAWVTGGGTGLTALATGTAQSGTASTIVLAGASTFADNELNGNVINIHAGTGAGQSRVIISNTLSDDTCNVSPDWATNPSSDSQYEIVQGSANLAAIRLGTTAADNLELQYDGTGLTGDAFPATQVQVGQLTVGSGGISTIATSGTTITTGSETLTFASTEELDGTTHDVLAAGGNTDFYYEFDVESGGVATAFSWWGYPQSNGDTYAVLGYDWVSAGFKQIGTLPGSNGSTITEHTFIPAVNMTGTGANIGLVRLQFTSADGTEIFTDRVLCEFTQAVQGIANGSTVTLSAATTNTNLIGKEWILDLGGQNITGSFISGATVTGIGTATAEYEFEECDMGAVTLDNDGHFERCALEGTFTVGQAGTFTFHQCFTESAAAITIDFGAVGATAIHLLDFHGEVNFKNMAAGDTVHITGAGDITTETCSAGTIDHDGFFEYTDAGGNVTEQKADIEDAVDATLVDTAEIGTAGAGLSNINLPNQTMDITGSLSGSVGSVTGAVGSVAGNVDGSVGSVTGAVGSVTGAVGSVAGNVDGSVASVTAEVTADITKISGSADAADKLEAHALETLPVTISSGGSTTTAVLNQVDGAGASATDDVYNGRILVFNNGTLNHQVAEIIDYDGGTTTATITAVTTAPGATHTARMV